MSQTERNMCLTEDWAEGNYASQYDNYKDTGEILYNLDFCDDFHERLLPRERELLGEVAHKALERVSLDEDKTFRIACYGMGSGRDFVFAQALAQELAPKGVTVEVLAQDIEVKGLKCLANDLKKFGFSASDAFDEEAKYAQNPEGKKGFLGPHYQKDNLHVRMVCSHPKDTLGHTSELLGKYHMLSSLFGVFSTVPGHDRKVATLKMLGEGLQGAGFISVAAPGRQPVAAQYHVLQQAREDGEALPLSLQEDGSVTLIPSRFSADQAIALKCKDWDALDEMGREPYRLYTFDSFGDLLEEAGLHVEEESVVSVQDVRSASANARASKTDCHASRLLSKQLNAPDTSAEDRTAISNSVCYIGAVVSADRFPEQEPKRGR